MNNKKKIIKILTTISFLSVSLFAFTNTNEYKKSNDSSLEKDETNEAEVLSENSLSKNIENGLIFPRDNRVIYNNRFTQPIISMDPSNPGFMGIVQEGSDTGGTRYVNQISWTGENLITEWSYDITKHPDIVALQASNSADFVSPFILGGIHSDNGKTSNFTNQIILIVGDSSNLNNRKFAIIRYDTILGEPIRNAAPVTFTMQNSPTIDSSSPTNAHALTMTYDQYNDRYIVYYPGPMRYVANDMKSLKINISNNLSLETNPFSTTTWPTNNNNSAPLFNENNHVLAIKAVPQTRDGSGNLGMILHNGEFTNHVGTFAFSFSMIEFKHDLSVIDGWRIAANQMSIAKSDFNNYNGTLTNGVGEITVSLNSFWDYFNPYMVLDTIDANRYTASMILPVTVGTNVYSMRLVFIRASKFFDNKNSNGLPLSNVNFNNSSILSNQRRIYNVWYNDKKPLECIITINSRSNSGFALSIKYVFPKSNFTQLNASKPSNLEIREAFSSSNTNHRTMVSIESYNHPDLYYTSSSERQIFLQLTKLSNDDTWINNHIVTLSFGGLTPLNPSENANRLNWLNGQSAQKTPSQILIGDLFPNNKTLTTDNLLSRNYLLSLVDKPETITDSTNFTNGRVTISDNSIRNDASGTISGDIGVNFAFDTPDFDPVTLSSKIPFFVSGFRRQNTNTVLIARNQETLNNTLPSDITRSNITDFFTLNNLPSSVAASDLVWSFSDANNAAGTLNVSVTTPRWYQNGVEQTTSQAFSAQFNMRKIPGTQIVRNSISVADLTVWDVNANNIGNYVNFVNVIPGTSIIPTYTISNQNGLAGTLTLNATIRGGFYDPGNNGLPNPTPNGTNTITLSISISGFKKVGGATTVAPITGDVTISPSDIVRNPNLLRGFLNITNLVPNSTVTFSSITPNDNNGTLTATATLNRAYNASGVIVNDAAFSNLSFSGFKSGPADRASKIVQIRNLELSNITFPVEVNSSNISNFVQPINLPTTGSPTITYRFLNLNNLSSSTTGGSLDVEATIKPSINTDGTTNPNGTTSTIRIRGFRSVTSPTTISERVNPILRARYPQFILPADIPNLYTIQSMSQIEDLVTSIQVINESISYNNVTGTIDFSYRLSNYFAPNGEFRREPIERQFSLSGFKNVAGPTQLQRKSSANISNLKASTFDVNKWRDYFEIINTIDITNLDEVTVEKISSDDSKGTVELRVSNISNYVDATNNITSTPGSFTTTISGFEIVVNNDSTFAIIGGAIGGLVFIAIIVALIIWFLNKKKHQQLMTKKSTKSNSTATSLSNPNLTKSIDAVPPTATRAVPPTVPPTATRAVPPPIGPSPTRAVPPPIGPSPTRAVPPTIGPSPTRVAPTGPSPTRVPPKPPKK